MERSQKNNELRVLYDQLKEFRGDISSLKDKYNDSTLALNKSKDEIVNLQQELDYSSKNYTIIKNEFNKDFTFEKEQVKSYKDN